MDIVFVLDKEVEEVVGMDKVLAEWDNTMDLVVVVEVADKIDTSVVEWGMDKVEAVDYSMEVGRSSCSGVHI